MPRPGPTGGDREAGAIESAAILLSGHSGVGLWCPRGRRRTERVGSMGKSAWFECGPGGEQHY